jgi:hypothetical protein
VRLKPLAVRSGKCYLHGLRYHSNISLPSFIPVVEASYWIICRRMKFSNSIQHTILSAQANYSPGVVTASAIYVPVSLYIYYNFIGSGLLNTLDIILSIIIGFAVMYVPTLIQKKRKGTL